MSSEEEQNNVAKVQRPCLPFPELPVALKVPDAPILLKSTVKPEATTLQPHSTAPEQPSTANLDSYLMELDAKMQKAKKLGITIKKYN